MQAVGTLSPVQVPVLPSGRLQFYYAYDTESMIGKRGVKMRSSKMRS